METIYHAYQQVPGSLPHTIRYQFEENLAQYRQDIKREQEKLEDHHQETRRTFNRQIEG